MRMHRTAALAAVGLIAFAGSGVAAEDKDWGRFQVEERRSGYTFAQPETRAMQDDDFENPAFIWIDEGRVLWDAKDGEAGKACGSCHNDASDSMRTVGASYPKYNAKLGKMQNIEQRVNQCRTENMKAKAWKWESKELLSMTAFVRHQARGLPMNVKVDGDVAPFFEKGKEFYYQRRGQLDMSCANCHEDNPGGQLRANILSQGQSNGFPTYRLKWQKIGSLHRRFRGCNRQVRATPYKNGSDEYVNLELFVNWRGRGLPVETPAVRN